MKNFYWIDSFDGYPPEMAEPIQLSISTYGTFYSAYAKALGYDFHLLRLEDLRVASAAQAVVWHAKFGNILAQPGGAYVGLIHPDPQKAGKLEVVYRLAASASELVLLNYAPKFPMVCRDKFRGVGIARDLGLRVPASVVLEAGCLPLEEVEFVEKTLGPYPLFVRPPDLTAGLGKKVLNDRAALQKYAAHPPFSERLLLVQPYIEIDAEFRVYLDQGEVIACRVRRPLENGVACTAPAAICAGSQALADHLEATYLCVDWLWDGQQYWFCEFETGGGFIELGEPDRSRVAKAFFQNLRR